MSRSKARSKSLGVAEDIFGDLWDVRQVLDTKHGFAMRRGLPQGMRTGLPDRAGPARVILTPDLAAFLEAHRAPRDPLKWDLPLGRSQIKKLRSILGHHGKDDAQSWWMDRLEDLSSLTHAAFAAKHGRDLKAVQNASVRYLGLRDRASGWWRFDPARSVLLSGKPIAWIAEQLGCSAQAAAKFRYRLESESPGHVPRSQGRRPDRGPDHL